MLTKAHLDAMPLGEVFAEGLDMDTPGGLNLANTGHCLKWVAVVGKGINDWAIYAHRSYHSREWILDHGDKVHSEAHIRQCVPCDDAAFAMYRH